MLDTEAITLEANLIIRRAIINESGKLLDVPYVFGAEWVDYTKKPAGLDCSEFVEGVFHLAHLDLPDGSQAQYNATVLTAQPRPGDLSFLGKSKDPTKIYHVGIVYDDKFIIECRGFDPTAKFETGKVILREKIYWENYKNFCGYGSHKKLV